MYASKAIESADIMAYKITKKWQHEDAGYDILPQARMVFNMVMGFIDMMLNSGMKNTHQKMISGKPKFSKCSKFQTKHNLNNLRIFSVIKAAR